MPRLPRFFAAVIVVLLAACETGSPEDRLETACSAPAEGQRLVSHVATGAAAGDHLAVFLHGAGKKLDASSSAKRADRLAADVPEITAVAIARPGYTMNGAVSPGNAFRGYDNATPANTVLLVNEIRALKAEAGASRVTLIGHSEGALSAAAVAACAPDLVDQLYLGACPCVLSDWPETRPGLAPFRRSPSPVRLTPRFRDDLVIRVATMQQDTKVDDGMGRDFVAAASAFDVVGSFDTAPAGAASPGEDFHGWRYLRPWFTDQLRASLVK